MDKVSWKNFEESDTCAKLEDSELETEAEGWATKVDLEQFRDLNAEL